jgi:hypothetical protein
VARARLPCRMLVLYIRYKAIFDIQVYGGFAWCVYQGADLKDQVARARQVRRRQRPKPYKHSLQPSHK